MLNMMAFMLKMMDFAAPEQRFVFPSKGGPRHGSQTAR